MAHKRRSESSDGRVGRRGHEPHRRAHACPDATRPDASGDRRHAGHRWWHARWSPLRRRWGAPAACRTLRRVPATARRAQRAGCTHSWRRPARCPSPVPADPAGATGLDAGPPVRTFLRSPGGSRVRLGPPISRTSESPTTPNELLAAPATSATGPAIQGTVARTVDVQHGSSQERPTLLCRVACRPPSGGRPPPRPSPSRAMHGRHRAAWSWPASWPAPQALPPARRTPRPRPGRACGTWHRPWAACP